MLAIMLFIASLLAFVSILIIRGIRIECEMQGENTPLWRKITALDQLVTIVFLSVFLDAIVLLFPVERFIADVWYGTASVIATALFFLREKFVVRDPNFLPKRAYYLLLFAKKKG